MKSHVILQPAGSPDAKAHYADTIDSPVFLHRILRHLIEEQRKLLPESVTARRTIPVWGVTPGDNGKSKRKWERIQAGDVVLFAKQRRIFSSAVVVHKVHSRALAVDLWQTDGAGETWEYIYFMDEVNPQNITYAELNRVAGYKPKAIVQEFNVLDDDISEKILSAFELYSEKHYPPVSEEEFRGAIHALESFTTLDVQRISYGRVEQAFLRKTLFDYATMAKCCLCGLLLPKELLVAAHIKKRSACTHTERLDFRHVVTPMCRLGCDELFEKGYVFVDDTGHIISNYNSERISSDLVTAISKLEGRICASWKPETKAYFDWHRQYVLRK